MKTLCSVAAVLGLATLCHSASLACQNLTNPLPQGPDVGNYVIICMMLVFLFCDFFISIWPQYHECVNNCIFNPAVYQVSGTWYIIAVSSPYCLVTTLTESLLSLSAKVTFSPTEITENVYIARVDAKM